MCQSIYLYNIYIYIVIVLLLPLSASHRQPFHSLSHMSTARQVQQVNMPRRRCLGKPVQQVTEPPIWTTETVLDPTNFGDTYRVPMDCIHTLLCITLFTNCIWQYQLSGISATLWWENHLHSHQLHHVPRCTVSETGGIATCTATSCTTCPGALSVKRSGGITTCTATSCTTCPGALSVKQETGRWDNHLTVG